ARPVRGGACGGARKTWLSLTTKTSLLTLSMKMPCGSASPVAGPLMLRSGSPDARLKKSTVEPFWNVPATSSLSGSTLQPQVRFSVSCRALKSTTGSGATAPFAVWLETSARSDVSSLTAQSSLLLVSTTSDDG